MSLMDLSKLRQVRTLAQRELSKVCHFLDELPKELRLQIYDLVLVRPDHIPGCEQSVWKIGQVVTTKQLAVTVNEAWNLPDFLATCKQIRAEALPVYLEKNTFLINCHWHDPTVLLKFHKSAKKGTKKYSELTVMLEMDDDALDDCDLKNIRRWLRMYYDGVLPYRPRYGVDQILCDFEQPRAHKFVTAMFDMLEVLQKAGCDWHVVRQALEHAYEGASALADWD